MIAITIEKDVNFGRNTMQKVNGNKNDLNEKKVKIIFNVYLQHHFNMETFPIKNGR